MAIIITRDGRFELATRWTKWSHTSLRSRLILAGISLLLQMWSVTLFGAMKSIDSEDDFRSGCRNVSQCHLKQSFSGLHSPGRSYFTLWRAYSRLRWLLRCSFERVVLWKRWKSQFYHQILRWHLFKIKYDSERWLCTNVSQEDILVGALKVLLLSVSQKTRDEK